MILSLQNINLNFMGFFDSKLCQKSSSIKRLNFKIKNFIVTKPNLFF